MVRRAGGEPGRRGGGEVRFGRPQGPCHRQVGQRLVQVHHVDGIRHEAETVAHVGQRHHNSGAGVGVEHHADGVFLAADAQRVDLDARLGGGQRRADLQHVRAQDLFLPGGEVVGVVLH
ncbi:hypothetical protein D9M72_507220 [compost metagenome]